MTEGNLFTSTIFASFYVLSWHCVRGLISPATANEPTIDVLFYFVTFVDVFSPLCIGVMYNNK